MLLNLSNHSSSKWQPEQIRVARVTYGAIVDMQFPNIPPDWDEQQVKKLVEEYVNKCVQIINQTEDKVNAIHIMGELTFCYAFVKLMECCPFHCIASTTERVVTVNEKGEKVSAFNFCKFRNFSA